MHWGHSTLFTIIFRRRILEIPSGTTKLDLLVSVRLLIRLISISLRSPPASSQSRPPAPLAHPSISRSGTVDFDSLARSSRLKKGSNTSTNGFQWIIGNIPSGEYVLRQLFAVLLRWSQLSHAASQVSTRRRSPSKWDVSLGNSQPRARFWWNAV